MNYSEYHSRSRRTGNTVFYTVLACCLLAVGVAAWFAARSIRKNQPITQESNPPSSAMPTQPDSTETPSQSFPENSVEVPAESPAPSSVPEDSAPAEAKTKIPVFCMPVEGEIIKGYSDRELQYSATYGDMRLHLGVDIACEEGAAVSAAAAGNVTAVEESATYGTVVTIDHGGEISTQYASLKDVTVQEGQSVAAGDVLGTAATVPSECGDPTHVHLALLKNGKAADPASLFK